MTTEIEKEAALHFTLTDFADMVRINGVPKIMSDMDEETFWQLYKWFGDSYGLDPRK